MLVGASSKIRKRMSVGCKKRIGAYLKRDGKSHPANINNRAFGDNWPGFPLNLARYGSEFLAADDGIRPTRLRKERRDVRRLPPQNLLHASSFKKL